MDHIPVAVAFKEYCIDGCATDNCKKMVRGARQENYWLANVTDEKRNCKITGWELSHYALHTWIGYEYGVVPSVILSVFFEIYEHFAYDCASYLDLGWNLAGALTGRALAST